MVAHYLGTSHARAVGTTSPYKAFVENIERLKQRTALSCSNRELDRYLWLAGLYLLWKRYMDEEDVNKKKRLRMNAEVEALFNELSSVNSAELAQLYPQHPEE